MGEVNENWIQYNTHCGSTVATELRVSEVCISRCCWVLNFSYYNLNMISLTSFPADVC